MKQEATQSFGCVVVHYHMSEFEATKAFTQSVINEMLKESPEFIMHYSIEQNAEEVYNQYMGIPMEM